MSETDTREQSCEARINEHMDGRSEQARKLLASANGDTVCKHCAKVIYETGETELRDEQDTLETQIWEHEDTGNAVCEGLSNGEQAEPDDEYGEDSLYEWPLAIEVRRVLRIDISTGGPGDWLEAALDEDGEVTSVSYHFNDWYDHAERTVYAGDSLYELAERYAETQRLS